MNLKDSPEGEGFRPIVETIRRVHQAFSDGVSPTFFKTAPSSENADRTIGLMLYTERMLATSAFDEASGRLSDDVPFFDRDDFARELGEYYIRYGVAAGPNHAGELVRSVEAQARAQAARASGMTP